MSAFYCGCNFDNTVSTSSQSALGELKRKIIQEQPLTLSDLTLLLQVYPIPQMDATVFTVVGVKEDGVTPFVDVSLACDALDVMFSVESRYRGSCIHLVFQGSLPWMFTYTA